VSAESPEIYGGSQPSRPKVAITGAAGLIGQNLIIRLKARGYRSIVGIDKHPANTPILARLHPDITTISADLAKDDGWQDALKGVEVLVVGHAQIGGSDPKPFRDNNVVATQRLIDAAEKAGVSRIVHISSSVVNSAAIDWYTETKKEQEQIVKASSMPSVVLRPTLMFGLFDRKHIGWLARFMQRVPVFPVPGTGRFRRQPLYAGNFCDIIIACMEGKGTGGAFNISGLETIDYIELIRLVRKATGAKTPILRIPYSLFWMLLWLYARFDREPPFTTRQLEALVIPELFEVIDWPGIFGVQPLSLAEALKETFGPSRYSDIVLEF
jgi:nucleoside-diphosphate-sugar epimerase